jgi:hypothetical protein
MDVRPIRVVRKHYLDASGRNAVALRPLEASVDQVAVTERCCW